MQSEKEVPFALSSLNLTVLSDLSICGLFALINEDNHLFRVAYSTDILNAIVSILKRYREDPNSSSLLEHPENVRIAILETGNSKLDGYSKVPIWEKKLASLGYTLDTLSKSKRMKLRIAYDLDFHTGNIQVCLVSAKGYKSVIGVFSSATEAEIFVEKNYRTGEPIRALYASNDLTIEYLKARNVDLDTISYGISD